MVQDAKAKRLVEYPQHAIQKRKENARRGRASRRSLSATSRVCTPRAKRLPLAGRRITSLQVLHRGSAVEVLSNEIVSKIEKKAVGTQRTKASTSEAERRRSHETDSKIKGKSENEKVMKMKKEDAITRRT